MRGSPSPEPLSVCTSSGLPPSRGTDLRAPRLEVAEVRARRDLEPFLDARRPHLDVILACRREAQVARAHLDDAKRNLQPPANLACVLDQLSSSSSEVYGCTTLTISTLSN